MKIGAMAASFKLPFDKMVRTAAKLGITGLQINISEGEYGVDGMTDERIKKLQDNLSAFGMEISAFCGDMGYPHYMDEKANKEKMIPKSKRMVDLAHKMGVKVITTHIGVIPDDENDPMFKIMQSALSEIGAYAAQFGVTFAIETGPEKAATLKKFLDGIPAGIGVNLDPANFRMVISQDPVEAVHMLGKYIVHTHAKDGINLYKITDGREAYGTPDPTFKKKVFRRIYKEVALGKGQVPWKEYLQALKDVGYDGYLTIERECGLRPVKDIEKAATFLLQYTPTLVYGLIGCGGICNGLHIPAIKKLKNVKVKYTCDIVLDRAKKAADRCGIKGYTKAVEDYHEVLADPEVTAVIVCTHTHLHCVIAREALLAGKCCLSEKPVGMNYEEAIGVSKAAHETGLISNVGVVCRFNSGVEEVKKVIDSGKIGKVYSVFNTFRSFRRVPGIGGEFTNKSHAGGGVLNDIGVHNLDQILYILGDAKPLTASACTYLEIAKDYENYHSRKEVWTPVSRKPGEEPVCDVEEYVTGLVRMDKYSINFTGAWAQNIDHDEWFIDFLGDKGGIRLKYCGGYELFTDENRKFRTRRPKFKVNDMSFAEHLAFRTSVITRVKTRAHIDNLLNTANVLDGLYRSAEKGEEVKLDASYDPAQL